MIAKIAFLRAGAAVLAACALLAGCGIPDGSYLRIGGAARPEYAPSPLPLHEKAALFEKAFADHISPEGVNIYLMADGQSAAQAVETTHLSDCAIWTGTMLGAECLRLAVTGDPDARDKVRRLARGLHALHEVTGTPGYFARCLARRSAPVPGEGGEWHAGTGAWAAYRWKGDTSKDQYAGIIFGLALAARLSDDPEVRALAAGDAGAVADRLLANRYRIAGPDGHTTTYGNLDAWIAGVPIGVNASISLAAMKAAWAATSDRRYTAAYQDLLRLGAARAVVWAKFQAFGRTNGNNDVMAMLSLFTLLMSDAGSEERDCYRRSLERFREFVRYDGNSFFNFIISAGLGGDRRLEEDARLTLRLFPLEKRNFSTDVRDRPGIERAFFDGRRGAAQARYPLPINYRSQSTWAWRDNPRRLEDQTSSPEGSERSAPTDYLTAYWIGRYLGILSSEE